MLNRSLFARQALVWLCLFCFSCTQDLSVGRTSVVVRVNDSELTAKDFAEQLAQRLKRFDSVAVRNPGNIKVAKDAILEEFINRTLLQDYAKSSGIQVADTELDNEIEIYRKQYPTDLALKETLAAEGKSFEEWKSELRLNLLQRKVFATLKSKIPQPTEAEMKSYYDANKDQFAEKARVRLRQILFAKQDDAERLLATITPKADFEALARKFSIAPEASNGGDTGWIEKGTLDVFDSAFTMPIGKRSPVLKSPYGFHIYEVLAKKPESQLNFEQAKAKILALMLADREQAVYAGWMEEQLKKARVFKNEELIASVKVSTKGEK